MTRTPEDRRLRRKTRERRDTAFVRALRALKRHGLTWRQLAVELGVAVGTVRGWACYPPEKLGRSVAVARARMAELGLKVE